MRVCPSSWFLLWRPARGRRISAGTGKCDQGAAGCDKLDPSNPTADAACISCVERVFGADYRPCSCCIRPILEGMVRYWAHTLTC